MKKLIYLFILINIWSCQSNSKQQSAESQSSSLETFGESFVADSFISVSEAMEKLKATDSINVKISGYVTGVCQTKGCWMQLSNQASDTSGFFVKFKDYGFFMPKDLADSKVIVNGVAYKEITSVEELQHYAEDEGKSKEEIAAITQSQEELKIMANGVVVVERK